MFYNGFYVSKDLFKAFKLFKSAATQNVPDAQYYIGLCYDNGYGIAKNVNYANYWLTLAANNGSMLARNYLQNKIVK